MYIGQIIQATVEKLVFQGRGLIRHQGWVVFVDDVASGEEVLVKIIQKKKSFYIGTLEEVVVPSPHRVQPRCPYFGRCGGCQLQHLDYPEQVRVKEEWVNEAIKSPLKVVMEPAPTPWAYRRKVTLHFEWHEGQLTLGYFQRDNRNLIDVKVCPIFVAEEESILKDVRAYLSLLKDCKGAVTLLKEKGAFLLRFFFEQKIPRGAKENLPKHNDWASIWLESHHESIKIKENPFEFSPHVFLQNFPEQASKLYQDVVSTIDPGKTVLDLYCGVGILTKLLAEKAKRVIGVESNPEAIRQAKISMPSNVQFFASTVEKMTFEKEVDAVIVNPPRIGLSSEVIEKLLKIGPKELLYISCDPQTLRRDLAFFEKAGYSIVHARSYDMFPQTTHLETFVQLRQSQ